MAPFPSTPSASMGDGFFYEWITTNGLVKRPFVIIIINSMYYGYSFCLTKLLVFIIIKFFY
jgi:hypothetical protein